MKKRSEAMQTLRDGYRKADPQRHKHTDKGDYNTLLIFKCLHQMAPVYLTVMSDPVSASASRSHLRSGASILGGGNLPHFWSRVQAGRHRAKE